MQVGGRVGGGRSAGLLMLRCSPGVVSSHGGPDLGVGFGYWGGTGCDRRAPVLTLAWAVSLAVAHPVMVVTLT